MMSEVGGLLAIVFFALVLPFAFAAGCDVQSCNQISEVSGKKAEWHFPTGCFVEVDGKMVPTSVWREESEE